MMTPDPEIDRAKPVATAILATLHQYAGEPGDLGFELLWMLMEKQDSKLALKFASGSDWRIHQYVRKTYGE
jgi:hypothetical protein